MGLFDYVTCRYQLPPEFPQDLEWQSKSTPAQYLDHYEIREDGTLWHEHYTHRIVAVEDDLFGVHIFRDNPEWRPEPLTGELEVHGCDDEHWYAVQFWFRDGVVKDCVPSVSDLPTRKAKEPPGEQP